MRLRNSCGYAQPVEDDLHLADGVEVAVARAQFFLEGQEPFAHRLVADAVKGAKLPHCVRLDGLYDRYFTNRLGVHVPRAILRLSFCCFRKRAGEGIE